MTKQILTLRKGIVEEQVSSSFYLVKDVFTDDLISVTISARKHIGGLTFSVGETIYIIVSLGKVRIIKSTCFPKTDYGTTARKWHGKFSENLDVEFNFWTTLYDLKRGRFYSDHQARGINIDFEAIKRQLDNGIDPLNLDKD